MRRHLNRIEADLSIAQALDTSSPPQRTSISYLPMFTPVSERLKTPCEELDVYLNPGDFTSQREKELTLEYRRRAFSRLPHLGRPARAILALSGSSTHVERIFSKMDQVASPHRFSLAGLHIVHPVGAKIMLLEGVRSNLVRKIKYSARWTLLHFNIRSRQNVKINLRETVP